MSQCGHEPKVQAEQHAMGLVGAWIFELSWHSNHKRKPVNPYRLLGLYGSYY